MKSNKYTLALAVTLALGFSAGHAQVVVRDAQTGQMRAPTAQEAAALQSKSPAATNRIGMITGRVNPPEIRHANGAVGQELDASTMMFSVARIGADGKLTMACISGEEAAQAAVNAPRTSFARKITAQSTARSSQEYKHEVQ